MSDQRLHELLATRPPNSEIDEAGRRAREWALQQIDAGVQAPRRRPSWRKLAAIAAVLAVSGVLTYRRLAFEQPEAISSPGASSAPIRVILKLDDGTKVYWTFDDALSL